MRFLFLTLFLAGSVAIASIMDWNPPSQVLVMVTSALILAWLWSRQSIKGVEYERQLNSTRAHVGESIEETVEITNVSHLPKLWLEFRGRSSIAGYENSRVLTLRGRQKTSWSSRITPDRRGRQTIGPATIHGVDPFGLFGSRAWLAGQMELTVYPAIVNLGAFDFPEGHVSGGMILHRRSHMITPAVSTIRSYVQGDPLNRIAWNVSAKHGQLMVKEFDPDPENDVWLVLDLTQPDPTSSGLVDLQFPAGTEYWRNSPVEMAITLTASLTRRILDQKRSVGLIAIANGTTVIPPESSERQYLRILDYLATAEAAHGDFDSSLEAVSGSIRRHNLATVITSGQNDRWIELARLWKSRGAATTVMLIDWSTFGFVGNLTPMIGELTTRGIPLYRIGRDRQLRESLSLPHNFNESQSWRPTNGDRLSIA